MAKKNAMLERLEAQIELKYAILFKRRKAALTQMVEDAAMIAAKRVFGMGEVRAKRFHNELVRATNEIAKMVNAEVKDDSEFEYAKAKIDAELCRIVGKENFTPWEERYY